MREANNRINEGQQADVAYLNRNTAAMVAKESAAERILNALDLVNALSHEILEREKRTANAILGTLPEQEGKSTGIPVGDGLVNRIQTELQRIHEILFRVREEQMRYDVEVKY